MRMTSTMTIGGPEVRPTARLRAGGDARSSDLSAIRANLDNLASELRRLWSLALEVGDFDEVNRLTEASHAVHRATVALSPDSVVLSPRPSRFAATG